MRPLAAKNFANGLWTADTFVNFDHGLNSAMKRLRNALDDDPDRPRFVETIPRHGYRFIAPITETATARVSFGVTPAAARTVAATPKSSPATPAMAKNPQPDEAGHHRTQHLSAGKRSLIVLTICALMLSAAAVALYRAPYEQTRAASRPSIVLAVLAFRDLTPVPFPSQSFVAEGMTQELITHLNKLDPEHVAVTARAFLHSDGEDKKSLSRIGSELVVQYVLDGSTRLQGDHLRVSVQLIEVSDQRYVWAESYDEKVSDLLQAQAAIAAEVSAAIQKKLAP